MKSTVCTVLTVHFKLNNQTYCDIEEEKLQENLSMYIVQVKELSAKFLVDQVVC